MPGKRHGAVPVVAQRFPLMWSPLVASLFQPIVFLCSQSSFFTSRIHSAAEEKSVRVLVKIPSLTFFVVSWLVGWLACWKVQPPPTFSKKSHFFMSPIRSIRRLTAALVGSNWDPAISPVMYTLCVSDMSYTPLHLLCLLLYCQIPGRCKLDGSLASSGCVGPTFTTSYLSGDNFSPCVLKVCF